MNLDECQALLALQRLFLVETIVAELRVPGILDF